ncbi:MAG: hypothetical protein L0221_12765, partial [Chloroflexi bacterium]|nr:hypothetical protein [Chloroflexota bacterium]
MTNRRAEPCALVVTPEATLQITGMTRNGRPVTPSFGRVLYLDGISETLRRTYRVVPGGESVTAQIGAPGTGLLAVSPTRGDIGVAAQWPIDSAGEYEVTAVYSVPNAPGAEQSRCAGRSNVASVAFTVTGEGGDDGDEGSNPVLLVIGGGAVVALTGVTAIAVRRRRRGPRATLVVALVAGLTVSPLAPRPARAEVTTNLDGFNEQIGDCLKGLRIAPEPFPAMMSFLDTPSLLVRVVGTMDSRSPLYNDADHPFFGGGAGDVSAAIDYSDVPRSLAATVRFDPTLGAAGVDVEDGVPWDNCAELLHELVLVYLELTDFDAPEECDGGAGEGMSSEEFDIEDDVAALVVENLYRRHRGLPEREMSGELPDFEPAFDPCDEDDDEADDEDEPDEPDEPDADGPDAPDGPDVPGDADPPDAPPGGIEVDIGDAVIEDPGGVESVESADDAGSDNAGSN